MKLSRSAWIGGGGLLFVGLVFAMVPPTKPLGGARIDPNAHHGLADLPAPRSQPAARASSPAAGFSGPAATMASAAGDAWPWRPASEDDAPQRGVPPAIQLAPPPHMARAAPPLPRADPRYAYSEREPEPVSADEDRAFRAGYRWAQSHDIDDPRACRDLDDGPGSDGCAAYARVAQTRYARDDRYGRGRYDRRYARDDRDDEDDGSWR